MGQKTNFADGKYDFCRPRKRFQAATKLSACDPVTFQGTQSPLNSWAKRRYRVPVRPAHSVFNFFRAWVQRAS